MSQSVESKFLSDETATLAFGHQLAKSLKPPLVVFLQGELGVGKTTLVRGFLQGLGFTGIGKSPTYTLVESYAFEDMVVYHFDLYRLSHPEELVSIGIRDYFDQNAIVFVEWAEKGSGFLPKADLHLALNVTPNGRCLNIKWSLE